MQVNHKYCQPKRNRTYKIINQMHLQLSYFSYCNATNAKIIKSGLSNEDQCLTNRPTDRTLAVISLK